MQSNKVLIINYLGKYNMFSFRVLQQIIVTEIVFNKFVMIMWFLYIFFIEYNEFSIIYLKF